MSTDKTQAVNEAVDSIQAKIFKQIYVNIERLDASMPWSNKVHAINWFNTRSLPLYNFYNMAASRSVVAVGGVPIFKGRLTKRLLGTDEDQRSVLLLVQYPSPENFKTMLENTYFKLVSVFRSAAVKQFTFCLSNKIVGDGDVLENDSNYHYAVHHFRGESPVISKAQTAISSTDIEMVFASVKTHRLVSTNGAEDVTPVPDIIDGIMLFRAINSTALENTLQSDQYKSVVEDTDASFIALMNRLL